MYDLHCHILPGIDDGPQSMAETLEMCGRAVQDGIHSIVATPHTLSSVFHSSFKKVMDLTVVVQEELAAAGIPLTVYPGAEIHVCPDLLEQIENGDAGTINNNGSYVLVEFPVNYVPPRFKEEIFRLKLKGITPIIAHPERNSAIAADIAKLYELVLAGALCQVTAFSITGEFGEGIRQCAEQLLRAGLVHVIASDAHAAFDRVPVLSEAVDAAAEILKNYEEATGMVTRIPAAIIAGRILDLPAPVRANLPKRKTWW